MKQTPKIIVIENKKLVGFSIKMSLIENKTFQLFSNFMPQQKHIQNKICADIFEVLIYDPQYLKNFSPKNTFTKWATVEVENYDNIPKEMESLDLKNGLYAVFNYKGLAQDFSHFMQYIYTDYLPKSDYKLDDRPHFNLLGKKYKHNNPNSEESVCIPIQFKQNKLLKNSK